ncbi:MAG: hypothetical protein EPN22_00855 [Nitrospirae bacterium]|nr:MAG: hypothetical protein EPN22_00855 [Nitrospirota bacterium]
MDKDTGRMLSAGASEVQWVRCPRREIPETIPIAMSRLSRLDCVVVEGNSAIEFLKPDIVIFLLGFSRSKSKPSAFSALKNADIVLIPEGCEDALKDYPEIEKKPAQCLSFKSFEELPIEELLNLMKDTANINRLEETLRQKAIEGKIPCGAARKIAEELGLSYKEVGETADALKIKIKNCELGCF